MSDIIPKVRVGKPLRHEALSVFPLFAKACAGVEYVLADEALHNGSIVVKEVSTSGPVSELLVSNKDDTGVLFIEGEELIAVKQNRILNTSILVNAKSRMKMPVSCVEQGRWLYRSSHFGHSGSHSPSKLRYVLKKSVYASLKAGCGHQYRAAYRLTQSGADGQSGGFRRLPADSRKGDTPGRNLPVLHGGGAG